MSDPPEPPERRPPVPGRPRPHRRSRVPAGRFERLARFGLMAGEFAASSAFESARRALAGGEGDPLQALLTPHAAERLVRRLSRMRGAAMKLGQLLSLESEDVLPPEFVEVFSALRSTADTMPPGQVRRVLGQEYGKGWESRFAHFDYDPVAAASIGQVHAATAPDGRELALKIQYPGVARSIDSDVDNVAVMLRMANLLPVEIDVRGIIDEAKRQLRREADYLEEAASLRRYACLVADEPRFAVPAVHEDFTTRRVLAMDYVHGVPIEDLAGYGTSQERRDSAASALQRLVFRELFDFHFMQTDPNFANYYLEPESDRIVLLDFGSAREFSEELGEQYKRVCRAVLADDREGVREAAGAIGYLPRGRNDAAVRAAVELILLVCEPLRTQGVYDFGASDLSARARDAGLDLMFRQRFLHMPPPETVFLHRKLAGSFLLCARIKARVDVRSLLLPFLAEGGPAPVRAADVGAPAAPE